MKAAAKIWSQSEACGFRYITLLSDGDDKTHKFLNSLKIYGPNVEILKEDVLITISTDKNPMHMKCPPGKDSWCFYRRALAKGEKPAPHKFNIGTPINPDYLTKIVPIYQRLASDSLLIGCARDV
ncbi:uncharacterized protein TNCV_4341241 [Trichonephila clavipes]|nr:uncharacterized protein TNCV_4341241 [Trichonephila clavipes]